MYAPAFLLEILTIVFAPVSWAFFFLLPFTFSRPFSVSVTYDNFLTSVSLPPNRVFGLVKESIRPCHPGLFCIMEVSNLPIWSTIYTDLALYSCPCFRDSFKHAASSRSMVSRDLAIHAECNHVNGMRGLTFISGNARS